MPQNRKKELLRIFDRRIGIRDRKPLDASTHSMTYSLLAYVKKSKIVGLDPLTLGWRYLDQKLVPVVSRVAPAPVSVLQLVRCNSEKSKCSQRCSCRGNNVVCTELCKCDGEGDNCTNITPPMIGEDLDD